MLAEVALGAVRLAHALAAALWIGGTFVYALFPADRIPATASVQFRQALRVGIGVFVVTGALLAVERLGSAPLPPIYFALLVAKVALGIWMFMLARRIGITPSPMTAGGLWSRAETRVIALGVVVYAVALALRSIYENAVRG